MSQNRFSAGRWSILESHHSWHRRRHLASEADGKQSRSGRSFSFDRERPERRVLRAWIELIGVSEIWPCHTPLFISPMKSVWRAGIFRDWRTPRCESMRCVCDIFDVNKNDSCHLFSVQFVLPASARPPWYCNLVILLCDVINPSCVCLIIGIYWVQIQTFCSQALNSLLTTEYLVECVTGRGRCCQDVCVVWGEGRGVSECVLWRSGAH